MKYILTTLMSELGDFNIPDHERFYILTAQKHMIESCQKLFIKQFEEVKSKFKEVSGIHVEQTYLKSVYISGYGWIEFQESENKEFKLELK